MDGREVFHIGDAGGEQREIPHPVSPSAEASSALVISRWALSCANFCRACGSGLRVGLADVRMLTIDNSGHASGRQRKVARLSPSDWPPIHFCGSGDL